MTRKLLLLSALLLASIACVAQTTAVTATVTDSDGTAWANGSWKLSFQPGPYQSNPANYTIGGVALDPAVVYQTGTMDGSGVISFTTSRSSSISPIGSSYNLQICPNASSSCATLNFSTAGASLDISTSVNAVILAPRFQARPGTYGYNDTEAQIQVQTGSMYWNVTNAALRCYTGSAWTNSCSTGGATGFPITLGATSVAAGSTTAAVTGLGVDGATSTELGYMSGVTSAVQTQLNAKLDSTAAAGGDLGGNFPNPTVDKLKTVPFCNGYTPTNGQNIQYTTGDTPNPCYTAAAASGAFGGGLGASYQDATEIAAPANPAAGNDRLYLSSSTHKLACLTSAGADCMPSAGGGYPTPVTLTASASAELDFTTCISASYNDYQIRVNKLILSNSGAALYLQGSANSGSTYDATSGHYTYAKYYMINGGANGGTNTTNAIGFDLLGGQGYSTTGAQPVYGTYTFISPQDTSTQRLMSGSSLLRDSGSNSYYTELLTFTYTDAATINAFRIIPSAGTITSGTVTCQPLPK